MNINSKEFTEKFKDLIEKGYCRECIAIMTSPLTLKSYCDKCQKIFEKELWNI